MLKSKLQEELRQSTLAKDALKTSVLRLLLSAINYYEIQKGAELSEAERARLLDKGERYQATDEDVISVIQKEAKQRRESIEQFKTGGRQDLVDKETKELEILQTYLPEQMSEDEIKKLVKETIAQTGAKTIADMGKVMSSLIPKTKSQADGGLVSKIVKEELNS